MKQESLAAMMRRKRAVLFDLFHTLTAIESTWSAGPWTSEVLGVSREAWNEQLLANSRARLVGEMKDPTEIIRTMAHAINPAIPEQTIQAATSCRIERFAVALINVPREARDVLARLKSDGKKLGLVSNADVTEVAAWDRSPITPLFDSVVFSCNAGCVKPEPAIYELSMRQMSVAPAQCVFVGDGGSRELEGAGALGITTVLITGIIREIWPDKIDERKAHADYVIEKLGELIAVGKDIGVGS